MFPERIRDLLVNSLATLPQHLTEPPENAAHLPMIPLNYIKIPPPSIHLPRLGFLPRYASTLTIVAFDEIDRIAREEADKGWETRRLTRARRRISDGLANWLAGMFESESKVKVLLLNDRQRERLHGPNVCEIRFPSLQTVL